MVDDASGMVVSAMLERLGGQSSTHTTNTAFLKLVTGNGRLITICDVDSPPAYPVMTQMNFPKELTANVLSSLNWGTADEAHTPSWVLSYNFFKKNCKRLMINSCPLCRASAGILWFGKAQNAALEA